MNKREPYILEKEKELTEKILEALRPIVKGYSFPEIIVACYQAIFTLVWEASCGKDSE